MEKNELISDEIPFVMIEIRQAKTTDVALIQQIAHKTWPTTYKGIVPEMQISYMLDLFYATNVLEESMTQKEHLFLLCYEGENCLGFACIENNYQEKSVMRLHKLYVLPEAQGKKAGQMLIQKITEISKAIRMERISLNVNKYNNAIGFYEKMGFEIIREEIVPLDFDYVMDDYVMEMKVV